MTKKIKIADLPEFDMAEELKTEEDIAIYLTLALEENDPAELVHALKTVARARGMTEVARASGVTREALYKALRPTSQPRFDTIMKVIHSLGLKISVQPALNARAIHCLLASSVAPVTHATGHPCNHSTTSATSQNSFAPILRGGGNPFDSINARSVFSTTPSSSSSWALFRMSWPMCQPPRG